MSQSRRGYVSYSFNSVKNLSYKDVGAKVRSVNSIGRDSASIGMSREDGDYDVSYAGNFYKSIRRLRNGGIEVTQDGLKTRYKGSNFDYKDGNLRIDGKAVTRHDDRIVYDERPKTVKEQPKLANEPSASEQKDQPSSSALIQNVLKQAPVAAAPEQKLTEEGFITDCSQPVKDYLNRFKDKKSHSAIVEEMKLTAEEMKLLDKFLDPMTREIMNKPLELNEKIYDLSTILGFKGVDPYTNLKFQPSNVQDCRALVNEFEATIKKIEADRKPKPAPEVVAEVAPSRGLGR